MFQQQSQTTHKSEEGIWDFLAKDILSFNSFACIAIKSLKCHNVTIKSLYFQLHSLTINYPCIKQ